jgi:hypothetical protein
MKVKIVLLCSDVVHVSQTANTTTPLLRRGLLYYPQLLSLAVHFGVAI